jgi:hypothetical protein
MARGSPRAVGRRGGPGIGRIAPVRVGDARCAKGWVARGASAAEPSRILKVPVPGNCEEVE